MRIDYIVSAAIGHLMGRAVRRAIAALALAVFAVVAVYHFTVAGIIALDGHVGPFDARLIVGGIYAAMASISLIVLWATRRKPAATAAPVLSSSPREMQLVMLVEAVMLGYALARKRERAS